MRSKTLQIGSLFNALQTFHQLVSFYDLNQTKMANANGLAVAGINERLKVLRGLFGELIVYEGNNKTDSKIGRLTPTGQCLAFLIKPTFTELLPRLGELEQRKS